MATTFTVTKQTVYGDNRIILATVTMGDGAANIATGLNNIVGGSVTPKTATSGGFGVGFNLGTGNTAIVGTLSIRSCTSGDTFYAGIFGN
jgi:hypothetical protein